MKIEKLVENNVTTLVIKGRVDTTTAPEFESNVDACVEGLEELILDCKEIEYISSAGLRVILKAQKVMNKQGSMKLINVNDTIMEVFDITGFADILTIE